MNEEQTPPAELVFASRSIVVRHEKVFLDKDGKTTPIERVSVRVLPFRLFNQVLDAVQDDAKLAALYCDREVEWTDTLTESSLVEILNVGEEINRPRLAAFVARRAERISGLLGGTVR